MRADIFSATFYSEDATVERAEWQNDTLNTDKKRQKGACLMCGDQKSMKKYSIYILHMLYPYYLF